MHEGGAPLGLGLVLVLAAIWAVVLLPSLLRSRISSSPIDGVRNFEQVMGVLGGTRSARRGHNASGRWVMVPRDVTAPKRRARVIQRRRRMFVRLVAVALLTLPLGAVPSLRWVWFVQLATDATLGLYVWRLLQWKRDEAAQAEPAHLVPVPAAQVLRPEPVLAFDESPFDDVEEAVEQLEADVPLRARLATRTG
ncbi:MAG: hypothetical protein ACRDJM_05570 [Actinomycetota bacterium]